MIKRFRVRNYKALKDVTLDLTPLHLLIGPNDSGKTSLLEALSALCRSVDLSLANAFPGRWEGTELVTDGVSRSDVVLECETDSPADLRYGVEVRFPPQGRSLRLVTEAIQLGEAKSVTRKPYRLQRDETSVRRFHSGHEDALQWLEGEIAAQELMLIQRSLSPVHSYRWNARLLAEPCALDVKNPFRMQASGFGLARVLDDILGFDRQRFMNLETRFHKLFPDVSSIRLVATNAKGSADSPDELVPSLSNAAGKGIYVRFVETEADIPARQLSEGMILILAYLAVLYSPKPPRVLLIEEPENGVHPSRLKQIIEMLRELLREHPETQVVLTSHSPHLVDLFSPEEVTLCDKGPDGYVHARRLSESELVKRQSDIFSLGEIWPADEQEILQELSNPSATLESSP